MAQCHAKNDVLAPPLVTSYNDSVRPVWRPADSHAFARYQQAIQPRYQAAADGSFLGCRLIDRCSISLNTKSLVVRECRQLNNFLKSGHGGAGCFAAALQTHPAHGEQVADQRVPAPYSSRNAVVLVVPLWISLSTRSGELRVSNIVIAQHWSTWILFAKPPTSFHLRRFERKGVRGPPASPPMMLKRYSFPEAPDLEATSYPDPKVICKT